MESIIEDLKLDINNANADGRSIFMMYVNQAECIIDSYNHLKEVYKEAIRVICINELHRDPNCYDDKSRLITDEWYLKANFLPDEHKEGENNI